MNIEENKESKQEYRSEQESFIKITITKEAADGLLDFVGKVNDGFEAGRVHRQDVASWIINQFLSSYSDSDLSLIRKNYYNEAVMLEAMYRRMKETGEIPDFLRDALRKQFQVATESPKKNKKSLTRKYINDVLESHEEVA